MGRSLVIVGVILVIVALAIHYAIKGMTLFPHASLTIGVIGIVVAVVGVVMMRPRAAR